MRIKWILVTFFNSIVLLIITTQTLGRSVFFWASSGFFFIPTVTLLKGQVKYLCAAGCFEKPVKAELSNVSYTLLLQCKLHVAVVVVVFFFFFFFFTGKKQFSGEYFWNQCWGMIRE